MSNSSSRRVAGQQQQDDQSAPGDEQYDDYVYYPYYPKAAADGRYEYVQEGEEYEQPMEEYQEEPYDAVPALQRSVNGGVNLFSALRRSTRNSSLRERPSMHCARDKERNAPVPIAQIRTRRKQLSLDE